MRIKILFVAILLTGVLGMGIVHANKPNQAPVPHITISPSTLVLSADSRCVSVHSNIPFDLVDCDTLELSGITPYLAKKDSCGDLVAKFDVEEVKAIVEPGPATLMLTGYLLEGTPFAASDTIMVKE